MNTPQHIMPKENFKTQKAVKVKNKMFLDSLIDMSANYVFEINFA